jgi:uncharacterized protein (DUF2267 family)
MGEARHGFLVLMQTAVSAARIDMHLRPLLCGGFPCRQETFKLSSDPMFVEKVRGIPEQRTHDGTHKTPAIRSWLARHPRFQAHFTPTSASWLNQVERWLATLTEKQIRRGGHRSTRELEQAIRDCLELHNADPKPFVWAKTADDILASVERFCLRISNSGHQQSTTPSPRPHRAYAMSERAQT